MIFSLAVLAVLAQDAIEAEAKFRSILERTEKAGLVVPDLAAAVAELEALSRSAAPSKELLDRFAVLRSQAAVLTSVHARLLKGKGSAFKMPLPSGAPVEVRIVDLTKRGVKIDRQGVGQEFAYADLDPEWMASTARPDLAGEAPLTAGLWLAKAARWEAAFLALGDLATDHPLAVEARKRGVESAAASLDSLIKSRKWQELLVRLDALEKLASPDARLEAIRGKALEAMVEHGKELCRKGSKGPMNDVIDLITKHFPDAADRIADIREAKRWIKVTDPKLFGIESVKGPPWTLEAKEENKPFAVFLKESTVTYLGIAAVIKFPKGEKAMAGLTWDNGLYIAGISAAEGLVGIYTGNRGEMLMCIHHRKVDVDARHHLSVRHREGSFVVQYNGEEFWRGEGKADAMKFMALHVSNGKGIFDDIQLQKKE